MDTPLEKFQILLRELFQFDCADLDTDRMLNLSLVRLVEVVGKAASRAPEEFRVRHPNIPWRQTVGMGNRLIHGYDTVNFDILWAIIYKDFPSLIEQMRAIVGEQA